MVVLRCLERLARAAGENPVEAEEHIDDLEAQLHVIDEVALDNSLAQPLKNDAEK